MSELTLERPVTKEAAVRPDMPLDGVRALVMLGGIPLWGQERGNIQVFEALRHVGVTPLFVTHWEYGHEVIQPALDRMGLAWTTGTYPGRISRGMGPLQWGRRLRETAAGNADYFCAGRRFRPTHIHVCNEGHFLPLLPAVRALRVPVIYRLGDEPRQHRRVFRDVWRRAIIPSVTRFVCVSKFIRERLIEAGAPPEKTRVIYSYPQEREPLAEGERLGGAAGEAGGDAHLLELLEAPFSGRTVTYVGQLAPQKGLHLFVQAALELVRERDDVRFMVAGDYVWNNEYATGLMREVEASGFGDRIRFIGFVEDVPRLLSASDVHVCPSIFEEPLANTVVEAKRTGVPSVVSASGGLPEIVDDGIDGTVVADKTSAGLRVAIESYLTMPADELASRKSAARSSLVRLGITKEHFTRAWSDVYASC